MTRVNHYKEWILLLVSIGYVRSFPFYDVCPAIESEPWSYKGYSNGPNLWGVRYPTCYSTEQSPVNIDNRTVEPDPDLEKLAMENYNIPVTSADVLNDGHTVMIVPRDSVERSIMVNGTTYTLQQLHFHWSKQPRTGTEHALDGKRFNMEGHFVHSSEGNQTAVVGVLYKTTSGRNPALQTILDVLPSIPYRGDKTNLNSNLNLEDLLPGNPSSFFRYHGSLTTPACIEGVVWSVIKEIYYIGKEQLPHFWKLYAVPRNEATSGCRITNNVRPLQRLNNRVIISSL